MSKAQPLDRHDLLQVTLRCITNIQPHPPPPRLQMQSGRYCPADVHHAARPNRSCESLNTPISSTLSRNRCLNDPTGLAKAIRVRNSEGKDEDTYDSRRETYPRTDAGIGR